MLKNIGQLIASILDAIASAGKWTTRMVWDGAKWAAVSTWEAGKPVLSAINTGLDVSQDYAVAGLKATGRGLLATPGLAQRGLNAGGDAVFGALWSGTKAAGRLAVAAPALALSVPGRVLGAAFGGGGGGSGPRAAQAGQQAQQAVGDQDKAAQAARQISDDVGLLQRVCRFRIQGHDIVEKFGDVVPAAQLRWVKALSAKELKLVVDADVRVVAQYLLGQAERVPGVRNADEIASGQPVAPSATNRSSEPTYTKGEQAVLKTLANRVKRRIPATMTSAFDDDEDYAIQA